MLKRNSKRLASAYEKLFVELRRRSVFKVAIACVVVGWLLVQIAATLFPIFNALAQLPTLNVAARTSAFSFKGRNVNLNEVGTELGVRRVLEGRLRHSSNQLRVTAQLIITTEAMVAELPKEEAPMPGGDMGGMGGMM